MLRIEREKRTKRIGIEVSVGGVGEVKKRWSRQEGEKVQRVGATSDGHTVLRKRWIAWKKKRIIYTEIQYRKKRDKRKIYRGCQRDSALRKKVTYRVLFMSSELEVEPGWASHEWIEWMNDEWLRHTWWQRQLVKRLTFLFLDKNGVQPK